MHILRVLEKVHHLFLIFFKLSFFWNGELSPSPTKGRCLHGSHGVKVLQTLGQDLNSLTPTLGHSRFHFLLYRFLKTRKVLRENAASFLVIPFGGLLLESGVRGDDLEGSIFVHSFPARGPCQWSAPLSSSTRALKHLGGLRFEVMA